MESKILLRKSIVTKLSVLILAAVLIPMSVISGITYNRAVEKQKKDYIETDLQSLQQNGENISNFLNQFGSLSNSLILDKTFTRNLEVPREDAKTLRDNEDRLRQLLLSNSSILSLSLYMENADMLYYIPRYTNSFVTRDTAVREGLWYKKTIQESEHGGIGLLLEGDTYTFLPQKERKEPVYTFSRCYRGIDGKLSAVLSLEIATQAVEGLCLAAVQPKEHVILGTMDSSVLYSAALEPDGTGKKMDNTLPDTFPSYEEDNGFFMTDISGVEHLVLFSCTYDELILYRLIPMSKISGKAMEAVMPNILIWLALTALMILLVVPFVVAVITRPLAKITREIASMKNGENFPRIAIKGDDEIALLAGKYNEMSADMERLIVSEYKAFAAAKNAQIVALQAQINPHFMGNMLQSIGNTVMDCKNEEAYTMLSSLSELIRYGYKADMQKVPLYEEIEYINRYLFLQKKRFQNQLSFSVEMEREVAKAAMPKLIFQPLIENSLEHGFGQPSAAIHVQIKAYRSSQQVILEIEDDGRGIETDRLAEIQGWLTNEADPAALSEHIGIRNVYTRLKLIFGEAMTFTIESELQKGTRFIIKFPVIGKGE